MPLMVAIARRKLEAGEDVRIADVAAELDVSPSLVNFYFGDRQRLIDAAWRDVLQTHLADDVVELGELAASADWDGLHALVRRVFSTERDAVRRTHTRAAVEARRNPQLAALVAEVQQTSIDQYCELLDRAVAAGTVRTDLDHDAIVRLVLSMPMGVSIVAPDLSDEERMTLADTWFAMLRGVLDPAAKR